MSVFHNNALIGAGGGAVAADFQIDRSLRFNSADSAYLNRTPSSAGNRKTWTWSGWVKFTNFSTASRLFAAGANNDNRTIIHYDSSNNKLKVFSTVGGTQKANLSTDAVFRDPSSFYHIVVSFDAASTNVDIYINGVEQTLTTSTSVANENHNVNNTVAHKIGQSVDGNVQADLYLAETIFVDGQALAASDFGEYDDNNVWQPKEYSGTYGTNGFRLTFSDNSSNSALGNDSSGNSNTWTVNNLSAAYNFGLTNAAQIVGTSQKFSFPITYTTTLTYEFFVRITADATYNYMAKVPLTDNWNIGTSGNSLLFGNFTGGWTTFSGTGLNDSEWHFVRLTTTGSSTSLYVDGSLIATNSSGGSVTTGSQLTNEIRGTGSGAFEIAHLRITTGGTPPTTGVPDISTMNAAAGSGGTLAFYDKLDDIASSGTKTSDGGNVTITMSAATVGVTDPNSDSLIDTPTNYTADSGNNGGNYCTLNPLKSRLTLSNGNLDSTSPSDWKGAAGTIGMSSGKYYWEIDNVVGNEHVVGIVKYNTANVTWNTTYGYGAETGVKYLATGGVSYGAAWTTGDVIGVAFDADNGNLEFYKNGTSQGVAATGLTDGPYLPSMVHNGSSRSASINFGQRPWHYSPKADHVALCTTNLADPTIADGSTAFDTALYSGNGSSQTITGLGFNPDLVWIKTRNDSISHYLGNTVVGINKNLESNNTQAESTDNVYGYVSATTSDGFTVTAGSGSSILVNGSSKTYVGWAWDAGTSTVSNTDGNITSSVRASQTNGCSIVTYSGDGSTSGSVGHGLNASPSMVIIKQRNGTKNWKVAHTSLASTHMLTLNENYATGASSWNGVTNSVFYPARSGDTYNNTSGENYVAYCFAPVEGFSAFGTYEGTASSNFTDPFVYTGHRSQFLLVKQSSASGEDWWIVDTARETFNPQDQILLPNSNSSEITTSNPIIDILSNGFKIRNTNARFNESGATYVFASFASHPFKTARAR